MGFELVLGNYSGLICNRFVWTRFISSFPLKWSGWREEKLITLILPIRDRTFYTPENSEVYFQPDAGLWEKQQKILKPHIHTITRTEGICFRNYFLNSAYQVLDVMNTCWCSFCSYPFSCITALLCLLPSHFFPTRASICLYVHAFHGPLPLQASLRALLPLSRSPLWFQDLCAASPAPPGKVSEVCLTVLTLRDMWVETCFEIRPHSFQNGRREGRKHICCWGHTEGREVSYSLLMGIQASPTTVEIKVDAPPKLKIKLTPNPAVAPRVYTWESTRERHSLVCVFVTVVNSWVEDLLVFVSVIISGTLTILDIF